jgi:hypothetical protein
MENLMSREFDHARMTAEQLSAALDQLGLTSLRLEMLTGTRRKTVEAWLRPEHDPRAMRPPFWLTSWLALMTLPGARDMADAVAAQFLQKDDSDDAP